MHDPIYQSIKGYELQERIGAGGFGVVYRAFQSTVGREVAVKIILPVLANQPEFIRRFEGEAQLVARLEHPFIVPLHDYWRDPEGAYLVMRYLRGGSLYDLIGKQGALSIEETVALVNQVAQALHTAHRNQVIHRDIKPGNILLDEDGNAYLADFGIAKDHTVSSGITNPDNIVGSPEYLAPEQARSELVSPQTDIYSLGVVLYEMLAGKHPFPNLSPIERLYKHLSDPLPEIDHLDDNIRNQVNDVIQRATSKDPAQRFNDVMGFAQALREAAQLDTTPTTASLVALLTPREQEVLKLMIEGKTNREIAETLVVEISTVKWYVNQLYRKLNVRSRVQAIVKARELDLVIAPAESVSISQLPEPENPYKGLRAFQAADAQDFFGREKLIHKLLARLQEDAQYRRFLAVVGPSGSGKSSVVRAGLIPALWRAGLPESDQWYIAEMIPGSHPLDELEVALTHVASQPGVDIMVQLQRDERGLQRVVGMLLPEDRDLLLVIDQFEEVFTLVEDEDDRSHFLNLLVQAITEKRSRVRVVVTLRADYYDRPLQYPQFGELMRHRVETVLPLSAEELELAIREPTTRIGVQFDDGLVSKIVSDVHYQPGALPLLQYALTELFERRDGHSLTLAAYTSIGGTGGALANRADEIYVEASQTGREMVRQLFLRLVTLGEGAEDTRRRVHRSELRDITSDTELMDEVIDLYATSRLLSLDHDPADRRPTVEVAHEAILREWERLRGWLNESREDIRQQRIVTEAASAWEGHNRDKSYLLQGTRLEQAEGWRAFTELALTPLESAFIESSIAEREAQQRAQHEQQIREAALKLRAQRVLQVLVLVFLIAAVGGIGLSLFAFDREAQAQDARATSEANTIETQSLYLAVSAEQANATNPDLALALSLEALRLDPDSDTARNTLVDLVSMPRPRRVFAGPASAVYNVAFDPSGRFGVSGYLDGTIIQWNLTTGEIMQQFNVFGTPSGNTNLFSIDISPDGRSVLVGVGESGADAGYAYLSLWNLETGQKVQDYVGHMRAVRGVVFSPEGTTVFSGSTDGIIIQWDVVTGEELHRLTGHEANVMAIALSLDGRTLISGDLNGNLMGWDVATGEEIWRTQPEGLQQSIYRIAINPDGKTALISDNDGAIILWDIERAEPVYTIDPNAWRQEKPSLAFSPDGRTALLGANTGELALWDIASQRVIETYMTASIINDLAFSPDGKQFLTAAGDAKIDESGDTRLWDTGGGTELARFDFERMGWFVPESTPTLAFKLQMAVDGPSLRLVEVNTGQERPLPVQLDAAIRLTMAGASPDGTRAFYTMVTSDADGIKHSELIVWDLATGQLINQLATPFEDYPEVTGIGRPGTHFTDDGRSLVVTTEGGSGTENNTVFLWNIENGQLDAFVFPGEVWAAMLSSDGRMLWAGTGDGIIHLRDTQTGEDIRQYPAQSGAVLGLFLAPDERSLFANYEDGSVIQWAIDTDEKIHHYPPSADTYPIGSITSDGLAGYPLDALNGIDEFVLWNLDTWQIVYRGRLVAYQLKQIDFPSDSSDTFVAMSLDGVLRSFELPPYSTVEELLGWLPENRYIHTFTCAEREQYRIEPLCDVGVE